MPLSISRCPSGRVLTLGSSPLVLAVLSLASPALAEQVPAAPAVSPVAITPDTLAPRTGDEGFRVEIPETGALQPPAGAETMAVTLGGIAIEGSFPEVAEPVKQATARLEGRRVSLAEIYALASEIEAIHARAGYVLARVSVPPQDLRDGGSLRLVVTDGFIETVDVDALPARIRQPVLARAGALVGRRHLTMNAIETALMRTSDLPGIRLRSTIMRGDEPGGARLVLEGDQALVTGSLGVGNPFDPSLGSWGATLSLAVNSAFGLGEQIYGFASSDKRVDRFFDDHARARVVGGGFMLPFGDGRFSVNPEVTFARTAPGVDADMLYTVGTLRRISLRGNASLVRLRREQAGVTLAFEQIDEANRAPEFATDLSHDRYYAARLAGTWSRLTASGARYGVRVQLSQGLGDLGAISLGEATAAGVPFSRLGAANDFTRIDAALGASFRPSRTTMLAFTLRGQTGLGSPLFRAEQLTLEGADGLSAYVGGQTATDSGFVVREEASAAVPLGAGQGLVPYLSPYVFAAFGLGSIAQPTALEDKHVSAFNLGAGLRSTLAQRVEIGVEYARGLSERAALDRVDRINVTATLRF